MTIPVRGRNVLAVSVTFWILAIVSVILRLWGRHIKRQKLVWNDYAIIVALAFASGVVICNIISVAAGGLGYHTNEISQAVVLTTLKVDTVVWIIQCFANTFVRLSFVHFLRQVFHVHTWFKNTLRVLTVASILYLVGCFITFFALCTPFEASWDFLTKDARCGNRFLPFLLSAVLNLILDLSILLAPLPIVWGLKTHVHSRIALTLIFSTGLIVCIITIFRTVAVIQLDPTEVKLDVTYTVYYDALWTTLEPSLGILSACLPLMAPVIKKLTEISVFSSAAYGSSYVSSKSRSQARAWIPLEGQSQKPFDRFDASSGEESGVYGTRVVITGNAKQPR